MNPEKVEMFYTDYLNGQDSMVTVFDVHRGGLIGAVTFIYRNGQLQVCYIGVRPHLNRRSDFDQVAVGIIEADDFLPPAVRH